MAKKTPTRNAASTDDDLVSLFREMLVDAPTGAPDLAESALNTIAMNKVLVKTLVDDARGQIAPGVYIIDALLKLRGTLTVGRDYEQQVVAAIDTWGLLALALSKVNGVTVRALLEEYEKRQSVGYTSGRVIKKQAEAAIRELKEKTRRTCRGKVTGKLSCDLVHDGSKLRLAGERAEEKRAA